MGQSKSLVLLAGAALSLSAGAAFAQNSDEFRSIVAEAMADAETRTSLLAAGDAGHDGRFFISGDGYRLNIYGLLQTRYVFNFRDDDPANTFYDNDETEQGFQIRRAKIGFSGDLNRDWFFNIRTSWDTVENDSGARIDYAFGGYKFANGVRATVGQFKLPLLREELVADSKQLAADRSITNNAFTQGYSQGIAFDYEAEAWRVSGAFSDGLNSANTDIINNENYSSAGSFGNAGEAEYAFTGRFEYMFAGNWRMFEDFTSEKGQDFGFLMGAAGHYQQSTNSPALTDFDRQTFQFTVDASLEGDSWNIFAAYIGRWSEFRNAGNDTDFYDSGVVAQGGWRFAQNTELFGRYDVIIADEDRFSGGDDTFNFLTFGLNHYWAGHAAKGTLDVVWALDSGSNLSGAGITPLPDTGVGLLGDVEEGEFTIRAQFQLMF
ncbi:MAG: porin [Phycisphaerales bacterium]